MENIIIPQIDGDVPDTLHARKVFSAFVREENAIPTAQFRSRHENALRNLRARIHLQ